MNEEPIRPLGFFKALLEFFTPDSNGGGVYSDASLRRMYDRGYKQGRIDEYNLQRGKRR